MPQRGSSKNAGGADVKSDVCGALAIAYQEAARLPSGRHDLKGRIHHDKRLRDVCATRGFGSKRVAR
jgi:hypothetical protein